LHGHGAQSVLAKALGSDIKGKMSIALYIAGIVATFVSPVVSVAIYVLVAVIWLVPDRRIENVLGRE
jgi:TMEM175 potassium channel family protein